jgi:hypothetical protein
MPDKVKNLIVILIIVVTGIFYLSSIREGHDWGDDFSMYISHAKNIAAGANYKDTGYIYNPFYPGVGPRAYPPVFPLLLSPIYKCYGLNLAPMKIESVAIFLLFLFLLYLVFKKELSFRYLAAMLLIIGFSPFFWNFKDIVASDVPFLFFLYLSFLVISRAYKKWPLSLVQYSVIAGFFIYLAYGTRNIGVLLIPGLFLYEMIRFKRLTRFSIIATLVFCFFTILQSGLLYTDISYRDQFALESKVILRNLFLYTRAMSNIWDNGYNKIFKDIFFAIFSIFAFIGCAARIKRRITIFEIFSALYLISVLIWPAIQGARFLMPIIPLYVFYAFAGIEEPSLIKRTGIRKTVFLIVMAIICVSYATKYTTLDYGCIREGIGKKETVELFDYIKKNTQKADIFIFQKPRALALYTGRKASVYHCPEDYRDLWRYFWDIKASYVIVGEPFDTDRAYLSLFVERYRNNLEEIYSNQDFKVYKIKTH